jgi:hypothetical protein
MQPDYNGSRYTPCHDFLCRACRSPLIQPLETYRLDDEYWSVRVRCPECYRSDELVLDGDGMRDLVNETEQAADCILKAAESLEREIFRHLCDEFTRALRADKIRPADF